MRRRSRRPPAVIHRRHTAHEQRATWLNLLQNPAHLRAVEFCTAIFADGAKRLLRIFKSRVRAEGYPNVLGAHTASQPPPLRLGRGRSPLITIDLQERFQTLRRRVTALRGRISVTSAPLGLEKVRTGVSPTAKSRQNSTCRSMCCGSGKQIQPGSAAQAPVVGDGITAGGTSISCAASARSSTRMLHHQKGFSAS